jgi:hypothetical protein
MSYAEQPIPYPAAHDYGPRGRWPTFAVVWHVAEGKNVAQYKLDVECDTEQMFDASYGETLGYRPHPRRPLWARWR